MKTGRQKNKELKRHIRDLLDDGLTVPEIARMLGKKPRVIYYHLQTYPQSEVARNYKNK